MNEERNLYFETVEALFYNGKTIKDIASIRYTNSFGNIYTIGWGEFAKAARKFNYKITDEGHIVNDSLEIDGMDGEWKLCRVASNTSETEKWILLKDPSVGDREIDPIELSTCDEDLDKYMRIGTGEETYYY